MKKLNLKKYILLIVLALVVLTSCEMMFGPKPKTLSDPRFNGSFRYFFYWKDDRGIEEISMYESYDFNGTSKCSYYCKYKQYTTAGGWEYSGDFIGDHYLFDYEIEINSSHDKLRHRLWDNKYDDWSEWMDYRFTESGDLILNEYGRDVLFERI